MDKEYKLKLYRKLDFLPNKFIMIIRIKKEKIN